MKSRGYTLRILPGLAWAGGSIRRRPAPAFSRGSGAAQPRKSVSIILHIYADTESYPQLPHSFQQPGGRASKAFNRYGNNLQVWNWTSFPCESGGLFDIISIWQAGAIQSPAANAAGPHRGFRRAGAACPRRAGPASPGTAAPAASAGGQTAPGR